MSRDLVVKLFVEEGVKRVQLSMEGVELPIEGVGLSVEEGVEI